MSNYIYSTIEEAIKDFPHFSSSNKASIKEGEIINNIKIIYRTESDKHGASMFISQCPYCNNFFLSKGSNIKKGLTKSCGCYNKQAASERMKKYNEEQNSYIQGERFGKLEVIEDLGLKKQFSRNKNERWIKCKCDCGEYKNFRLNELRNNGAYSCGCLKISYGEYIIEQILNKNNIIFKREVGFPKLISNKGKPLRFDFAIYNNKNELLYLIEFDGRQHFYGVDGGKWHTKGNTLEEIQERDEIKNQYCLNNNIPLLRIPYTKLKTLNLKYLKLETSDFIYYIHLKNKECEYNNRFLTNKITNCKECPDYKKCLKEIENERNNI